ncbi:hypothetical protein CEXT_414621 [Caerostris extrusa]|uniref:Uncharacterized protein n=1 Tax=Caerostris extrusa TaxID=172846 RepID=A0AAV4VVE9_CAEEX|nr:hypothetical protein CEXT_414621 [Caerostris extrusa]
MVFTDCTYSIEELGLLRDLCLIMNNQSSIVNEFIRMDNNTQSHQTRVIYEYIKNQVNSQFDLMDLNLQVYLWDCIDGCLSSLPRYLNKLIIILTKYALCMVIAFNSGIRALN